MLLLALLVRPAIRTPESLAVDTFAIIACIVLIVVGAVFSGWDARRARPTRPEDEPEA